ncbi:MAG: T9SS type A sorting domain-containing protein [Bacteroidales bacterium]
MRINVLSQRSFAIIAFLIFLLPGKKANAQNYHPIVQSGSDTCLLTAVDCDYFSYETFNTFILNDTTVEGIAYKVVKEFRHSYDFNPPYYPHYGLYGQYYIREDSASRKVYVRYPNSAEFLLYDFSLQVGDSIDLTVYPKVINNNISQTTPNWDTLRFYATAVFAVRNSVSDSLLPAILLQNTDFNDTISFIWIESIGALNNFFYCDRYLNIYEDENLPYFINVSVSLPLYRNSTHQKCKFVNGFNVFNIDSILVSERSDEPCDYQQSISLSVEENIECLNVINVFPNPAGNYITIVLNEQSQKNIICELSDSKGVILRSEILPIGCTELYLDLTGIENGIYFLGFKSDNATKQVKKIVVKK